MKKTPVKNTKKNIKSAKTVTKVRPVASKPTVKTEKTKPCFNPWSVSIYVYWFIILFFIASTFYILGRSHNAQPSVANIEITESSTTFEVENAFFTSGNNNLPALYV